jgi:hypothetical protein
MNPRERNQPVDAPLEGDISEADFLRLEAELSVDPAARRDYYDRLTLAALLEAEAGAAAQSGRTTNSPITTRAVTSSSASSAAR